MSKESKEIREQINKIKEFGKNQKNYLIKEILSTIPINLSNIDKKNIDNQILRVAILAEIDAINLYEQMSEVAQNKIIKKILLDIAKEEKTHIGEFQTLLLKFDKEQ